LDKENGLTWIEKVVKSSFLDLNKSFSVVRGVEKVEKNMKIEENDKNEQVFDKKSLNLMKEYID